MPPGSQDGDSEDGERQMWDPLKPRPVDLYGSALAEGIALAKRGCDAEAVDAFSKALDLQPDNKPVILMRGDSYLKTGNWQKAQLDADRVLKTDSKNHRAIFLKAESLFASGAFEFSLMYYHRGAKLRPDMDGFRLGIQKSQVAINDSVDQPAIDRAIAQQQSSMTPILSSNSPSLASSPRQIASPRRGSNNGASPRLAAKAVANSVALQNSIPVSPPLNASQSQDEGAFFKMGTRPRPVVPPLNILQSTPSASSNNLQNSARSVAQSEGSASARSRSVPPTGRVTERDLLGKLYDDKKFLEDLMNDDVMKKRLTGEENEIGNVVEKGLTYLSGRREFWRQQISSPKVQTVKNSSKKQSTMPSFIEDEEDSYIDASHEDVSFARSHSLNASSSSHQPRPPAHGVRSSSASRPHGGAYSGSEEEPSSQTPPRGRPTAAGGVSLPAIRSSASNRSASSGPASRSASSATRSRSQLHSSNKQNSTPRSQGQQQQPAKSARARLRHFEETRFAFQALQSITQALQNGELELSLKYSKSFLSRLASLDVEDKPRILASLYSLMGSTYLELNKLTLAVIHHRKDLDIAVRYDYRDAYARALENLGLTYERMGDFAQAIRMWEKKLEFSSTEEESMRLWEDIGRAHYQLGAGDQALLFLERAHDAAERLGDRNRQLSTLYTMGHSYVKMNAFDRSIPCFERCLALAEQQQDTVAIASALTDLGNSFLKLGDIGQSIRYQQKAMELSAQISGIPAR